MLTIEKIPKIDYNYTACTVLYVIVCWFDQAMGIFPGIILLEGLGMGLVFRVLVKFVIVKRERF